MEILRCLSQWEQVGEQVPYHEIQQALKREKKNASKLVALQNFNEELLSLAEEQQQFGAHAQYNSTHSESEDEEHVQSMQDLRQKQPQQKWLI